MRKICGTTASVLVASIACAIGCATKARTGTAVGVAGGAAAGGGIGAAIGGWKGAAIGAAVGGAAGGVAGAVIGRYMDAQEEELKREMKTATIQRKGDQLVVKFQSAILFDVDQSALKPQSQRELAELARVLKDYPDTTLVIEGHTDSSGSAEHNKRLSEARAQSVIDYLASAGVDRLRLTRRGIGEDRPLASNATPEGRTQNRRVEVHIAPNEDLRRADAQNANRS